MKIVSNVINKLVKPLIIILIVLLTINVYKNLDDNGIKPNADGFTISSYHIDLDVKKDNKVYVNEKILVNWYDSNHHGIYKFIPGWLEYTGKDGNTISRYSKIRDLKSVNDPYTTDNVGKNKKRIKIGSIDEYVKIGNKEYNISYVYDMGRDPYKGFDEFIFHAFGDYWGTTINNSSITITMPESIEGYNINFFGDKKRKNNYNDMVDYRVEGNKIYATVNNPLSKSLTVDIELPNGYFKGGSWNYGISSYLIILLMILLTTYIFYIWIKYGKNYKKIARTVEFYPPDNLDAAEIGYLYNGGAYISMSEASKFCAALIISLASKGYIKIDEVGRKTIFTKKKIKITNLYPDNTPNKPDNEKVMSSNEYIIYKRLFEESNEIILSEHKTIYYAFDSVRSDLNYSFKKKMVDIEARSKRSELVKVIILICLLFLYNYSINKLESSYRILYCISFLCVPISIFFTIVMGRKTEYFELMKARVLGFRDFLLKVEKDELESLVEKNPEYFYNILPYTYVLGISKKWISKFKDITIPKIDMGTFSFDNDSTISLFTNAIERPKNYINRSSGSSSGGGCSSCGGGCSSGSSGCSSCGGGGSW